MSRDNNLLVHAAGTLIIAIVGLVFADFALQWQPVPADVPMRTALVYTSNALLAILAIAVMPRRSPVPRGLFAPSRFRFRLECRVAPAACL